MAPFGDLLRRRRSERSLTQRELAERAGLTTKAVAALEQGARRVPYPHTVRALADALDLDDVGLAELVSSLPSRATGRTDRTSAAPSLGAGALPTPPGVVIGRESDAASLRERLLATRGSMITLTGPGGVGKTTLALVAAAAVRGEFPAGTHFVDLADTVEPDEVLLKVSAILGVPEQEIDGTPTSLAPFLAGRRMLLVLDNVEQVDGCATDLAALLSLCPDLAILATSRTALRIRAEYETRVEPLSHADAVRLFCERARSRGTSPVRADDHTVAELCRQADGLPLAVELAASVVRTMGLAPFADNLDISGFPGPRDLPPRQRSMAATVAWSYELLGRRGQALLSRLSLIPGSFAVRTVLDIDGGEPLDVLTAFGQLLGHSLVSRTEPVAGTEYYRLLGPIRHHVATHLGPVDREAATARLAQSVLHGVRRKDVDVYGPRQAESLARLEVEHATIRTVLHWLIGRGRGDDAADLGYAIALYLVVRGYSADGLRWTDGLRELPMSRASRVRRLVAETCLRFGAGQSALPATRAAIAEAVDLAREIGDTRLAAHACIQASTIAVAASDPEAAERFHQEAAREASGSTDLWIRSYVAIVGGRAALLRGRLEEAEELFAEATASARAVGSPVEITAALGGQAAAIDLAAPGERDDEVIPLLSEAVLVAARHRISLSLSYLLSTLAGALGRRGEVPLAARLLGAAASFRRHDDAVQVPATRAAAGDGSARIRALLGEDAFVQEWRAGRALGFADLADVASRLPPVVPSRGPS